MKTVLAFVLSIMLSLPATAQQQVQLRTMWSVPQVHVIFGSYDIYFTIADINKAMKFMPALLQHQYGTTSGLDTNGYYVVELLPGRSMEYQNTLQSLIQNGVGAYLLLSGHAAIKTGKHRKLHNILADIGPARDMGEYLQVPVHIYDPRNNHMIFSGVMADTMYKKDIGFD